MIHALAFTTVKPGMLEQAIEVYRTLVPQVMTIRCR